MSTPPIISVAGVSKAYRMWKDPAQRLFSPLYAELARHLPDPANAALQKRAAAGYLDFYALRDVSFEVARGEAVGIIGRNGSGKSTLLQIIAGTMQPTTGTVRVSGRVAALLELGAGFNPDFTGRENVFLNGSILGLTKREIEERFDDIAAFADIGDFIDQPVKTYSSGMGLRLAFAVQTAVNPEVLIVDEALAVGDMFFQAKCMTRLRGMLADGLTLLLVSHEPGTIKSLCTRGLLLDRSLLIHDGPADAASEKYFALKVGADAPVPAAGAPAPAHSAATNEWDDFTADATEFVRLASYQRAGNGTVRYAKVSLCDRQGRELSSLVFGQQCRLRLALSVHHPVPRLTWGVHVRDEHQRDVLYADATRFGPELTDLAAGERLLIELDFTLHLKEGRYSIHVGCASPVDLQIGQVEYGDLIPIACQFYAERPTPFPIYAPVLLQAEGRCTHYR